MAAFPRLLIVTDADLGPASRGAGRTLLNLLSKWPADSVRVISTLSDAGVDDGHGHRIFKAGWELPAPIVDRMRPIFGDLYAQMLEVAPLDRAAMESYDPEVVLVVPGSPAALVLGTEWAASLKIPSATWLMDDWVQQYPASWPFGSSSATAKRLLKMNAGWLVISKYLGEELGRWTGLTKPTHVVHNAVAIGEPPAALEKPRSGKFVLRYAGTIWPMHADALMLVARAVAARRAAGDDIAFVLQTDERGWRLHENVWNETGTVFGGLVPYESLRAQLADSDLLVVASSFAAEHERMTKSSVQTKITDYLASGRAIVNVGPADGACARFLREREIAVYIDSMDVTRAAESLRTFVADRASLGALAKRGWDVVRRDHEIGAVAESTAAFLRGLVDPRS